MFNKQLILTACLLGAGLAGAQSQPKMLGRTADVQGLVTVSDGRQVAGVAEGNAVLDGTRYVTSSTGAVTLKFNNCEVKLKPNQAVTVDEKKICEGMIAAIETLADANFAGGAIGGGAIPPLLMISVGAALIGGGGAAAALGAGGNTPGGGGQIPNPPITPQ